MTLNYVKEIHYVYFDNIFSFCICIGILPLFHLSTCKFLISMMPRAIFLLFLLIHSYFLINRLHAMNVSLVDEQFFFKPDQDDSLTFTKFGQICGGGSRHTRKTVIGCSIVYLSSTSARMSRLHKFHNLCDIGRSKVFPALRCILSTESFSCVFPL